MNAHQRKKANKPLTYQGVESKLLSFLNSYKGRYTTTVIPAFKAFLVELKPNREIPGFALYGDEIIANAVWQKNTADEMRQLLSQYLNLLAERELLGAESMNALAEKELLRDDNT